MQRVPARFTSLAALNEALWAWVDRRYNRAPHSALPAGQTPFAVYTAGLGAVRKASEEELERAFRHVESRRVRKDGTFSFAGAIWEAPSGLWGQEIELRYDPEDPTDLVLYRGKTRLGRARPFAPTDRLPARGPTAGPAAAPRSPLASSRAYLEGLAREHRAAHEAVIGGAPEPAAPARFTLAMLLAALDLAEDALSAEDRRSLAGAFDTFGPFDPEKSRRALARALARWGKGRHLTVYLRAIVEAHLGSEQA